MATDVRTGQVDVGEFRENLDHFLESTGAVRVTRDGEIIGVYTPLPKPKKLTAKEADGTGLASGRVAGTNGKGGRNRGGSDGRY